MSTSFSTEMSGLFSSFLATLHQPHSKTDHAQSTTTRSQAAGTTQSSASAPMATWETNSSTRCGENYPLSCNCLSLACVVLTTHGAWRGWIWVADGQVCALPYRSWQKNPPHPRLKLKFGGWVWNEGSLQLCALRRPTCFMHALRKSLLDPIWGVCFKPKQRRLFGGGMSTVFCRERDDLGDIDPQEEPPSETFSGAYTVHTRISQCGKEGPHAINHPTSLFSRVFAHVKYLLEHTGQVPIDPIPVYHDTLAKWNAAYRAGKVDVHRAKILS
eukprot:m.52898 g.52898  ORF g.52898 m.52898 type:complete len:272 (-) comp6719_c0_seq1:55-870(-)